MAHHIPDAMIALNNRFTIIGWNAAAEHTFGWKAEEAVGKNFNRLLKTKPTVNGKSNPLTIARRMGKWSGEVTRVRKDGVRIWVWSSVSVVRNEEGNPIGFICISRDVTERKRMDEKLRESQAKLASVVNSAMDAMISLDEDQRIILFNPAAESMFGCPAAEAMGQPLDRFIPERFREAHRRHIHAFGRTNQTRRAMGKLGQLTCMRSDGVEFPAEISISQAEVGGRKIYTAILRDITERLEVNKSLRTSETRFRALFEDVPIAIWEEDFSEVKEYLDSLMEQGVADLRAYFASHPEELLRCENMIRVMDLNNTAVKMFEANSKEELLAVTRQTNSKGELDNSLEDIIAIAEGRTNRSWEGGDETLTGRPIEISLTWSVVPGHEADYSKVIVTTRDITEQLRVNESLRESEERFRLLFENSPVAIWDEDFSRVKARLEELKEQGAVDLDAYLDAHKEVVEECLRLVEVRDVNRAALGLYETDRKSELLGGLQKTFPEESLRNFKNELLTIASGGLVYRSESRVQTFQDRERNVLIDWVVAPGHERDYSKVLVSLTDITERKLAEEALRTSEKTFRGLFNSVAEAIYIQDADGRFLDVNEGATKMYGHPREFFIGNTPEPLSAPGRNDLNEVAKAVEAAFKGQPQQFEFWGIRSNGEVFPKDVRLYKGTYFGQDVVVALAQDITERKQAEEEIRTLARFPSENPNPVMRFDSGGQLLYANPASDPLLSFWNCEVGGYPPPEWRERIENRQAGNLDMDCGEQIFSVIVAPVEGENYVNLYARDITERKKAEMARERLLNVLEASLNEIYIFDPDSLKFEYANRGALRNLGYSLEELKTMSPVDLKPEFTEESFRESIAPLLQGVKPILNFETVHRRADGSLYPVDVHLQLVETGNERAFLAVINDITQRKQAEEQLRDSEERFRLFAENVEEGFWITNADDEREVYLSPAIERIWGRPLEELIQPSAFLENILPEDHPIVLYSLERQKEGKQTDMEYRIRRPDGSTRWIWDRAFPILSEDGKVRLVTGLVTDITERKEAERKIRVHLQRITALNEIDRAIGSGFDMRLSLEVLLKEAVSQLGVDAADVLLMNPVDLSLEYVAGKGFRSTKIRQSRLPLGQGLAWKAGLDQKVLHIPDLQAAGGDFTRSSSLEGEDFVEYFGVPLLAKGALKGVLEIFNRAPLNPDPDWMSYLATLGGQAAIAVDNAQLFESMQRSNQELAMAYDATISGWSRAMDLRDKETEGHTLRVTELTEKLARRMRIGQQELLHIHRGALLHDIGKLGVPDSILLKPGKLTDEEWELMRQHPRYAFEMLLPIKYLHPALDIPYAHHEKWDGSGYPRGLKGEQIPLAARVFAVVDVWDALRSDRPYRDKWSAERAREYILEQSGKHFDPQVVEEFMRMLDEVPEPSL
ncbi:MAG: PAS domain S-box protein [Anaerolineales bacterium]|nr:PAS domain S-box protein [Anaerolineales bacterium]